MMTRVRAAFRAVAAIAVFAAGAAILHADVEIELSLGALAFRDEAWHPLRFQDPVGVSVRWDRDRWPVGIEARFQHERTRDGQNMPLPVGHVAFDMLLDSLSLGAVKEWGPRGVRPFAGGGLEALFYRKDQFDNDFSGGRIQDDGVSPGAYIHGGARWRVFRGLLLGFEARVFAGRRITLTDVKVVPDISFRLDERERASTYRELALRIGWGWSTR